MERSGEIVASGASESPFIVKDSVEKRLPAIESSSPFISASAKYLLEQYGNFEPIENLSLRLQLVNGQQQFLQVKTLQDGRGLDWLIVVTIPEADFSERLEANKRTTIWLCILALSVATLTGLLTARWVTQPLLRLNQAAKDLAGGEWNKSLEIKRSDEVGELAQSFNTMAQQLQESFSTLEQRVSERTRELLEAKETALSAQQAAEVANQAKDQFLVNISHELRTPLNAILGYTQILLRASYLQDQERLGLRVVRQSATHLLTLINDILDLAKTQAGKMELCPTDLHLSNFLQEVVAIVEIEAKEKQILLLLDCVGKLPTGIKADEKRLRQVLLNLLGNAVKFTPLGGKVTLRVSLSPHWPSEKNLRFEVIDTGVGISPIAQKKIFQPFEQVGEAESRAAGTGLGLSISQQLLALMGSQIQVKSQLGKGSTFWFELTVAEVELVREVEGQQQTRQLVGYKGRQRQILIVDDLKENRSLLLKILNPLGFKLREAENGKQGLEIACSQPPDLILTDLLMPVQTGLTMVLQLRQIPEFEQLPIIGLSASTSELMEKKSNSVGCNAFLPKPIDEKQLLAYLQQYLHLEWVYERENFRF